MIFQNIFGGISGVTPLGLTKIQEVAEKQGHPLPLFWEGIDDYPKPSGRGYFTAHDGRQSDLKELVKRSPHKVLTGVRLTAVDDKYGWAIRSLAKKNPGAADLYPHACVMEVGSIAPRRWSFEEWCKANESFLLDLAFWGRPHLFIFEKMWINFSRARQARTPILQS
jgi:hypothetical protein